MIRKPIISPIQHIQKEHSEKMLMVKMMADLMAIHKAFLEKHEEIRQLVQAPLKKGDKGDRGPSGTNAHMKGDKGEPGHTPTKDELLEIMIPLIPEVKDKKVILSEEHIDKIAERASKKIKVPKLPEIDAEGLLNRILALPKGKGLSTRHIDGLEQTMRAMTSQLGKGYLHGGGISKLLAGSGITLVINSDGSYTISSTGGGGGMNIETPIGVVDGSNVTYTFTNTPKAIVVDQDRTMIEVQGWTLAGLVATLDVAPTFSIYSFY